MVNADSGKGQVLYQADDFEEEIDPAAEGIEFAPQVVPAGEAAEFSTMVPHRIGAVPESGDLEILSIFNRDGERAHLHDA